MAEDWSLVSATERQLLVASLKLINELKEFIMSQFDGLTQEISELKTVTASNNALLDRLFAIVQENINNPAVLQEKVNELRAIRDELTAAVIRNTPAESENPPT